MKLRLTILSGLVGISVLLSGSASFAFCSPGAGGTTCCSDCIGGVACCGSNGGGHPPECHPIQCAVIPAGGSFSIEENAEQSHQALEELQNQSK